MANTVAIDYTSRDFDGLKQSLLDYAKTAFPDWKPASEGDFGVLMLELLAYTGDVLSYYVDRAQNEAYLPTATQRSSVLQIAQLLGYRPSNGTPAHGTVTLETSQGSGAVLIPAGTRLVTDFVEALDSPIFFETDVAATAPADGGTIALSVTEGETKRDETSGNPLVLGTSNGLGNQTFRLPNPKVYEDSVRVYVAGEEWLFIDHLLDADATEKRFTVATDAAGYTSVLFGDGLNGAVPVVNVAVSATFRVGVGSYGNVDAGRVIGLFDQVAGLSVQLSSVTSELSTSTAMVGGASPESTSQIRENAPRSFSTQQRAITEADFESFAVSVPGVAKANAVASFFSSVSVYVVGPDGGTPTQTLLDSVTLELTKRALAGVTVSVGTPTFVEVNVGTVGSPVTVQVWPTFSRASVEFQVKQAINDVLSFEQSNIGSRLTVSEFYSRIMDIDGVRYASIPLMARADAAQSGTADIQFLPWEFPKAGDVFVTTTGGIG